MQFLVHWPTESVSQSSHTDKFYLLSVCGHISDGARRDLSVYHPTHNHPTPPCPFILPSDSPYHPYPPHLLLHIRLHLVTLTGNVQMNIYYCYKHVCSASGIGPIFLLYRVRSNAVEFVIIKTQDLTFWKAKCKFNFTNMILISINDLYGTTHTYLAIR